MKPGDGGEYGSGGDDVNEQSCGVLVLDELRRIVIRNAAASRYLKELEDEKRPEVVPYAIARAVARLHARRPATTPDGAGSLEQGRRVRGRSGRWLLIRASLAEPNVGSSTHTIVLIELAPQSGSAGIHIKLYGLSPRQRQILSLAAMGETTKGIALRLGISPYTVQEHLGNACVKLGVRTRNALLAKLFFGGHASELAEDRGSVPAVS